MRYGLTAAAITYSACYLLYLVRYLGRVLPLMAITKTTYAKVFLLPLALMGVLLVGYEMLLQAA